MKTYTVTKKSVAEGQFPARAMCVYTSIAKLKTASVEDVAKSMKYEGAQDRVKLAGFFLSQFSKVGLVTLVETTDKTAETPAAKTTKTKTSKTAAKKR